MTKVVDKDVLDAIKSIMLNKFSYVMESKDNYVIYTHESGRIDTKSISKELVNLTLKNKGL